MNYTQLLIDSGKYCRSSPAQIEKILRSAPYRYRHYTVEKKSGGERHIYHPSPALKAVQRWLVHAPLMSLPVHECVYSYVKGRNIGLNAQVHAHSNFFVRFDFKDFFPSITSDVLGAFLRKSRDQGTIQLDDEAIAAVVRFACRAPSGSGRLALSIGAPSSPFLSNAILFDFDSEVSDRARRAGLLYTRYADDVYISGRSGAALSEFEAVFREIVRKRLPFISINEEKVAYRSRKRRVTVTGVNITSDRRVSVGRDLKRALRTKLFLALRGDLPAEDHSSLRGSIAYVMSIEPTFLDGLRAKFGAEKVNRFMDFSGAYLLESD